jgi:hypothetical protein
VLAAADIQIFTRTTTTFAWARRAAAGIGRTGGGDAVDGFQIEYNTRRPQMSSVTGSSATIQRSAANQHPAIDAA